jgi:hypothetical protein
LPLGFQEAGFVTRGHALLLIYGSLKYKIYHRNISSGQLLISAERELIKSLNVGAGLGGRRLKPAATEKYSGTWRAGRPPYGFKVFL